MNDPEEKREARNKRAFEVASEVYTAVFQILDAMPELDGKVAGAIAKSVQDMVETTLKILFVVQKVIESVEFEELGND